MISCSSANDTVPQWHTVTPNTTIETNDMYSMEQEGLSISNVQLYHEQQYRCEHSLTIDTNLTRSVIINVTVLGNKAFDLMYSFY